MLYKLRDAEVLCNRNTSCKHEWLPVLGRSCLVNPSMTSLLFFLFFFLSTLHTMNAQHMIEVLCCCSLETSCYMWLVYLLNTLYIFFFPHPSCLTLLHSALAKLNTQNCNLFETAFYSLCTAGIPVHQPPG